MRITWKILWVAGMLFTSILQAQTITLDGFLNTVRENHPFFQKEDLSAEIQMRAQEGLRGAEDWRFNASSFVARQRPVQTTLFTPDEINSLGADITLDRKLWKTGGHLSVGWFYSFAEQNVPSSTLFQNTVSAAYIHPLLQNRQGKLDKLDYELQAFIITITRIQAAENKEDFLLDIALRFLDWELLGEQAEIARERKRLAEEQLSQTRQRREANLVDEVDVLRSEDAVRIAEQDILLLEARWKAKQAELATISQTDNIAALSPDFDLYQLENLPGMADAVTQLQQRSRLLQSLRIQRERLAHLRDGAAETIKARLDLVLQAGLTRGKDNFFEAIVPTKEDLSVSLNYSIPFGNRSAKAEVEKTDVQIRQFDEDVKNITIDLIAASRNLLTQITEFENVLSLNREQILSAQKKTAEELKLYNQGRGQLTFVIQSRDNEQNAKLNYARNAKLYHQLVLQYHALADELFNG